LLDCKALLLEEGGNPSKLRGDVDLGGASATTKQAQSTQPQTTSGQKIRGRKQATGSGSTASGSAANGSTASRRCGSCCYKW